MRLKDLRYSFGFAMLSSCALALACTGAYAQAPRFEITVPAAVHAGPLTGRVVLVLAKSAQPEPRLAMSLTGPALFGVDMEQVEAGRAVVIDNGATAYPAALNALAPGDYFAQAVINVYDRVQRADGHTLWLPMNDGTIEFFSAAAGNLYSDPQPVHVGTGGTVRMQVTHVIPAAAPIADTEWLKHVRVQSDMLTKFWGRPIYIHATVLLPKGYNDNPQQRYPTIYALGHNVPFSFNPDSTRVRNIGQINPVTGTESGYDFYKAWTSADFPRVIAVTLQQQTPYFADSYSVNSANNGPYGDAIVEELIPFLEERFRLIRQPYARQLEGASTSGWQTLAMQLQHPEFFGGAWVLQPDPIDFTRYGMTNIYSDTNAFSVPLGQFVAAERYFQRTPDGQGLYTTRQLSLFEEVLGTRGRSSYQLGAWEAVYGPVGADGYPVPLWNKLTGTIDRNVASYMRDHGYDLRAYAAVQWPIMGSKLQGKLHFFAGDMDDYWLNLAVYKFEEFARATTNPKSDADFTYGRPMKGHSWHAWTWADFVRKAAASIAGHTPAGDDARRWHY